MNRRPTSVRLNACLLAASIILLAANLATGHVRGAIYATVAVIAFGSLLAVGIRENRANRPQVPLGAPDRDREDWLPNGHPNQHHDEGI